MSSSHSHPCVLNQRNGWVVRWFHAYWSFNWNRDDSGQWGSPGIPNTGEPALLLCRTYATIAYVRDNAVCRMPYEICRTGVRILSNDVNSSSSHSYKTSDEFSLLEVDAEPSNFSKTFFCFTGLWCEAACSGISEQQGGQHGVSLA